MLLKPLRPLLLAFVLIPFACSDTAQDSPMGPNNAMEPLAAVLEGPGITVMTQNLYLGANIDLLLTASTPAEFQQVFMQLLTSNAGGFGRAQKLAMQIVADKPHLVGLQEVTRYTFTTQAGTQVMDFLEILKLYLDGMYLAGATPHTWSVIRNDMAFLGPIVIPELPVITYEDADAILVRDDVSVLEPPTLVTYDVFEIYSLGGNVYPFPRGYLAVTAEIGGHTVRFANTHLEVQRFEATHVAQAAQLIEELEEATVPVVLVGDFNSAANHDATDEQETPVYK
ncbi:MAG: endonuclease/exonuclease/phosphatase family protein, partial [Gemmatimonadota bacterium]